MPISSVRALIEAQYAKAFSGIAALASPSGAATVSRPSKPSEGLPPRAVRFVARTLWMGILFASFVESCAWQLSGNATLVGNATLQEQLGNLTLVFPVISHLVDGENLTLSNLVCHSMTFEALNVHAHEGSRPPSDVEKPAIFQLGNFSGNLTGVGFACTADYLVFKQGQRCLPINCFKGTMYARLAGTSVDVTFGISTTAVQWRYAAETSYCGSVVNLTNLNFTTAIANKFVPLIEASVNAAAPPLLCAELTQLIDVNLTAALNDVVAGVVAPLVGNIKNFQSSPKFGQTQCIVASTVLGGVFFVYTIVLATVKWIRRRRQRLGTRLRQVTSATPLLQKLDQVQNDPGHPQYSHSLALSPRISPVWAVLVPLGLLVNIGLFITSNLSVGASVYATVSLGPAPESPRLQLPSLFSFTLTNSVYDMWQAGVYPLSVLIACFSGFWPYAKLALMLVCWWFPVRWLPVHRRERILIALDALGKWSLVDSYVLVLMLVAFRLTLPFGDLLQVDIFVQSNIGFYLFLLATVVSLVLTHFTLGLHRAAEELDYPAAADDRTPPQSIGQHVFGLGDRHSCRCTPAGSAALVVVFLVVMGMLGLGAAVKSFEFVFLGLTASVMRFLGQSATRSYSIIGLAMQLPDATFYAPHGFGIHAIQACFLMWTLCVPLAHIASLVVIWLVPMRPRLQRFVFHAIEILNAWSAIEVFVASVLAALLELETFAEFIIGDKCDGIDAVLAFVGMSDPVCFGVQAHLAWGCGIVFTAAIIYVVFSMVAMRLCHKALRERLNAAYAQQLDGRDIQADGKETERRIINQKTPSCWNSFWRSATVHTTRIVLQPAKLAKLSDNSDNYYADEYLM